MIESIVCYVNTNLSFGIVILLMLMVVLPIISTVVISIMTFRLLWYRSNMSKLSRVGFVIFFIALYTLFCTCALSGSMEIIDKVSRPMEPMGRLEVKFDNVY